MKVLFHSHFIKKYQNYQKTFAPKRMKIILFETDTKNPILNVHQLGGVWKDHWSINITGDLRLCSNLSQKIWFNFGSGQSQ